MVFTETAIKGVYLIGLERKEDHRGFFARAWCHQEFEAHGLNPSLAQVNVGFSRKKGTLRGMHFQRHPHQEAKLVRCTMGQIFDVAVDLRPDSPTYRQWVGAELTADNRTMLYVPEGCAMAIKRCRMMPKWSIRPLNFLSPHMQLACGLTIQRSALYGPWRSR